MHAANYFSNLVISRFDFNRFNAELILLAPDSLAAPASARNSLFLENQAIIIDPSRAKII